MSGAILFVTLSLLSLASVLLRRPWTIVVARRTTPAEAQAHPLFREANTVMSLAWTAVFAVTAAVLFACDGTLAALGVMLINSLLGAASPTLGKSYAAWRASAASESG